MRVPFKQVLLVSIILSVGVAFSLSDAFARKGNANGNGKIDWAEAYQKQVRVQGVVSEDGPMYLGCSIYLMDAPRIDMEPVQVLGHYDKDNKYIGDWYVAFSPPAPYAEAYQKDSIDHIWVALWRWKVPVNECHAGVNGGPCEWCKLHGYHLEGLVSEVNPVKLQKDIPPHD
jgi:hypothetical protein